MPKEAVHAKAPHEKQDTHTLQREHRTSREEASTAAAHTPATLLRNR